MKKTKPSAAAISSLIDDYVARGVFRAAALPMNKGSEVFSVVWFQNQHMTLCVDNRHSEVRLLDALPTIASHSAFDRELRAWLRTRAASELPAHRRIDPKKLQCKLNNRAGHMQLSIVSLDGDLITAARKLIQLTNELYLDFLSAPTRYNWIVETFELDPDNPKWP